MTTLFTSLKWTNYFFSWIFFLWWPTSAIHKTHYTKLKPSTDKTQNTKLSTQNSEHKTQYRQNSVHKTQNTKLSTQNSEHKTQYTKLSTQNPEHKTQYTKPRTQNSVHKTQNTKLRTQNSEHKTQNTKPSTQNPVPTILSIYIKPSTQNPVPTNWVAGLSFVYWVLHFWATVFFSHWDKIYRIENLLFRIRYHFLYHSSIICFFNSFFQILYFYYYLGKEEVPEATLKASPDGFTKRTRFLLKYMHIMVLFLHFICKEKIYHVNLTVPIRNVC